MSDSDSDYCDVGLEHNSLVSNEIDVATKTTNDGSNTNRNGKKVRGKDINWIEKERFETIVAYKESQVYQNIVEEFSCMRRRSPDYADTEHFVCKYSRKVGYNPCPVQYMVIFFSHNDEVSVACADGVEEHVHVHTVDDAGSAGGVNFKWTLEQTAMIRQCVQNEQTRPAIIRRNLENANLFLEGKSPTNQQLNNKIAHVKVQLNKTQQIFTTHHLREKIKENIDIPEDEDQAYIAFHDVIDENEKDEPRFSVIWTSKRMLARTNEHMTQDDATYRLVWQGKYLIFIIFVFSLKMEPNVLWIVLCALLCSLRTFYLCCTKSVLTAFNDSDYDIVSADL